MLEHQSDCHAAETSHLDTVISRRTLIKHGAATAAAVAGSAALVAPAAASAAAHTTREAPFNIVGRAQVTLNLAMWSSVPLTTIPILIKNFEASHPNIKVNTTVIPGSSWAAFFEGVLTRIAGGNSPDSAYVAIEGIALFGAKGLALPLNDFMKKDADYIAELRHDTVPVMFDVLSYKGAQIALPFDWNNMMVWYNTKLFGQLGLAPPQAGWTGDDFLAMCAKLKKNGVFGTSLWASGLFGLEAWSLAAGANLLSSDWSRSNALAKGNVEAWEFMHDLVFKHRYAQRPGSIPDTNLFEARRIGTFLAGRWPLFQLKANKFLYGDVTPFPSLNGAQRKTIIGIGGYPIFKQSKNPEAAWELSKFMSGPVAQYEWSSRGTNIPARRSLAYANWMNPPAHYKEFYDSLGSNTVAVTAPPQYNEVDASVTRWYSQMMTGQVAPRTALQGLDKDLTAILKKPV